MEKKNTPASATMMKTMIELTMVSRSVGQVTFETSDLTWFRKVKGFVFAAIYLPELRDGTDNVKIQNPQTIQSSADPAKSARTRKKRNARPVTLLFSSTLPPAFQGVYRKLVRSGNSAPFIARHRIPQRHLYRMQVHDPALFR